MGNYTNLNVLNTNRIENDLNMDAVDQVASMLKATGKNRSQRRRLEKSLGKMQTIVEHSQKYLDRSAYKEYQNRLDKNFAHFYAILALTMKEDYKWKEDATHDQISSLLERVNKKLSKYANQGLETEDLLKLCEAETDITLIPEEY